MSKKRKWADEQLVYAVKEEESYSGVLKRLGLKMSGGSHALVKLRIRQLELNTSHFKGRGWCYGKKHTSFVKKHVEIPLGKILVKDSTYQNTHRLKLRLIREGYLENKCYKCGIGPIWNEQYLSLQLDHIDGDRCNNEIINLRILCPNCHSQTPTFAGCKRPSGGTADTQLSKSCAFQA